MRTTRPLRALLLLVVIGLAGCQPASEAPVVVYLFRHAEKMLPPADTTDNPPLDPRGVTRAQELARTLGEAGITEIWSTDFIRTRQTVAPLAERLGMEVTLYDGNDLGEAAARLRTSTGRIAISGHSNTTPALVELLGGDPGPTIDEASEHDRLYVLHVGRDRTSTVRLRYGD